MVFDERDPPSFKGNIKSLVHEKNKTYTVFRKQIGNNQQFEKAEFLQKLFNECV